MAISINLLPGEKQPLGKFLIWVLTYGRYIIIGTEIIVLLAFLSRFKFDRDLTDLHQSIAQKQAVIVAAHDLELRVRNLQNHLLIIKKLAKQRETSPALLAILEKIIPEDVTLIDLLVDGNKLNLTAQVFSNAGFSTFLNSLSSSSYFGDISLDSVGKNKNGNTEFKISAVLKNI